jgi:hypothetical protein
MTRRLAKAAFPYFLLREIAETPEQIGAHRIKVEGLDVFWLSKGPFATFNGGLAAPNKSGLNSNQDNFSVAKMGPLLTDATTSLGRGLRFTKIEAFHVVARQRIATGDVAPAADDLDPTATLASIETLMLAALPRVASEELLDDWEIELVVAPAIWMASIKATSIATDLHYVVKIGQKHNAAPLLRRPTAGLRSLEMTLGLRQLSAHQRIYLTHHCARPGRRIPAAR